jgi:hypothetical protein
VQPCHAPLVTDAADRGGPTLTVLEARDRYLSALQLPPDAVSVDRWYRWLRAGRVPSIRLPSGRRLVRTDDLDRFIASSGGAQ